MKNGIVYNYIEGFGTKLTTTGEVTIVVEEHEEILCSPECAFINYHSERLKEDLQMINGYTYTPTFMCKRYDHFFNDETLIRCDKCLKEFPSNKENILFTSKCPVCKDNSSLLVRKEKDRFIGKCIRPACKFCTGYYNKEKELLKDLNRKRDSNEN